MYDPVIGRFVSQDPVEGVLTNPQSQNPYAYAGNNPVNISDPSGECPMCLVAAGIIVAPMITANPPGLIAMGDLIAQDVARGNYFGAVDKAGLLVPGGIIESSVIKFGSRALLLEHFGKHARGLGFSTLTQYLNRARNLFKGGKDVQTYIRSNGEKIFFNPKTGEFGVLKNDGKTMKTYFKPDNPVEYWKKQTGQR